MNQNVLHTIDPTLVGERIAEGRRERGLTQADLAQLLGVARTTVTAMEHGQRRPQAAELARIAEILEVPARQFVEPAGPALALPFPVLFRRKSTDLPTAAARDIRIFQQMCVWYAGLEAKLGEPLTRQYPLVYEIGEAEVSRAADGVATSERNRLGLGDGPIADVWGLLETDVGLRLVSFPMNDATMAGMFVFTESLGGCIAINAKHPPYRQRWTAIHEYAHFLADRTEAEVTVLRKRSRLPRRERFADAFARSFLMPALGLIRRFDGLKRAKVAGVTPADILTLAHLYSVSFDAMVIRLEELSLVPGGTREYLKERGFKPDEGRRMLGLIGENQAGIGPRRYLTLCTMAYQRDLLSEGQLAEYLSRDVVDVRDSMQRFLRQEDVSGEGEWVQGTLDLTTSLARAD